MLQKTAKGWTTTLRKHGSKTSKLAPMRVEIWKLKNWTMKVSLWVETQKMAESRTKKGPKALELHPWCWELRLMSALSELDETSALWLLRLMAASIGFYSVKSWLRHMTLEMHSKCIRLRRFILHSEYGKMPAHDFLIGRNQPTVRPS